MTQQQNTSFGTGNGGFRIGAPWRSNLALADSTLDHRQAGSFGAGPVLARADWLERALSDLPVVDGAADWQTVVLQRHARREAEFALAASLRSVQMGRATITMSDSSGTSIRMFGVRASSPDGLAAAATLWISTAREQATARA